MSTETKRPYDVRDTEELLSMESDNYPQDSGVWSILHHGDTVSIHAPSGGGWVDIPVEQFNEMVDWYMRPQPVEAQK
ncbi:hypothetical protein [Nitratireductor sp. GCM10026969]|uniref:hypothetical protein n=1 Tax=Nitratireductor sp. GCM10026969 TaxID=3252645 RepID=UPI0036095097